MTLALLLLVAQDWPQFRGPTGQGHAEVKSLPLKWSDTSANLGWKSPVDGLGWSSPVVADGKVWLTTATDGGKSLRAVALDAKTGRPLLDVEVFKLPSPGKIHEKNSHASPTPIVDRDRVYVHFGPNGTACLSTTGKLLWRQQMKYSPVHGPGGSPAIFGDLLVFSCDGSDSQFVAALSCRDGSVRWKVPREANTNDKKFAFSTPLVLDGKVPQVVSPGAGGVTSYDAGGRAVWHVKYPGGYSVVPRPVFAYGMVYLSTGYDKPVLLAIRADGRGDVTETHVAWRLDSAAPRNASPLVVGDELYVVSDDGFATCLDAKTGKVHWKERLGGNFSASPVHAAGRLYFLDERGTTTVLQPGKTFASLAKNELKGRTLASIAPIEGALFLRTDTHLFRIESEK